MTRKIVIIGTRGYPSFYGGFETAVRHLAPYLADRGWEVTVFGRPGAVVGSPPADRRVHSVITWGIDTKSLSTLSFGFFSVIRTVILRPDAALVMNVANGYWLPLLRLFGIPTAVNVDGIEWQRKKWGTVARSVFKVGGRLTAAFATAVVIDAKAIGQYWMQHYGREGVFIPYGGEPSRIQPVQPWLRRRKYVLMVARLVPENSIEPFLEAAEDLSAQYDIVIVGSAGYKGTIEEKLSALSTRKASVHWLGHVKDDELLESLWQHSGAYFHGHSVGGTNPALVQAMASGAPIVALDTVYNREVLGDAGIFALQTKESIAAQIVEMITNSVEQDRLSALARERAAAEYTWPRVCEAYNLLLSRLCAD